MSSPGSLRYNDTDQIHDRLLTCEPILTWLVSNFDGTTPIRSKTFVDACLGNSLGNSNSSVDNKISCV